MRRRVARLAALFLAALAILTSVYSLASLFIPPQPGLAGPNVAPFEILSVGLFIFGTPILGALIAVRRPGNPIGWLFLLFAFGWSLSFASDGLAIDFPPSPQIAWLVTIGQELGGLGFVSILLLLIYFPTGTLPSRRWWVLPFVEILGALASAIASLFMPGSPVQPPVPGLVNPLGRPDWAPALQVFNTIGQLTLVPVMIGCVVLLAVRIRRSEGVERQQLKWFGWATGVVTALLLVSLSVPLLGLTVIPFADAVWNLTLSSLVLLPAAAAIAILRYRLFDIDRLISRTVSYAILTAVLAVVYVAGFLGLQAVLSSVTESEGPVAVAASTLAVFALFTPVRRRIQAVVDRRFNRARYDAQQSAEAFAGRIRDEVNIEQLSAEVVRVLERTVQPASAGIWLRPSERVVER